MNVRNKLREAITVCALGGMVAGCDPPQDHDAVEDERVTAAAVGTVVGIISGVLSGANSLKNLFASGDGGPTVADLSDEALDQIQAIVTEATVSFGFEQYNNSLSSLTEKIGTYNEPDCAPDAQAGALSDQCANELRQASDQLFSLAGTASDIWASLSSDEPQHAAQRMQGAFSMVSIAGIRVALLLERAKIDALRQESAVESRETACATAGEYHERLKRLESEELSAYVDSHFGPIYTKITDSQYGNGYMNIEIISCFTGPGGEQCVESSERRLSCTGDTLAYCANRDEDNHLEPYSSTLWLVDDARNAARDAHFRELREQLLGGQAFDDLLAELARISTCEEAPACEPLVAVEAGPLWNNDDAQGKCPGVCEEAGGTFTKQWWTTVPNEMSVCQCEIPC